MCSQGFRFTSAAFIVALCVLTTSFHRLHPTVALAQSGGVQGKIAFTSDRDGNDEIYVMNADGTGVTRLTNDNGSFDRQPAWSPACDRIAFTKDPGGNVEIYVMNADGTGATRLTNSVGYDEEPAWSPDGTRIAFAST